MKNLLSKHRTFAFSIVLGALLAVFAFVAVRSGPLAPVTVTVATVQQQAVAPGLFGVGTIEARHTYRIGPTSAGRVKRLTVDVGDHVTAGQVLGEMDAVDLDDRIRVQEALVRRSEAVFHEAELRQSHAVTQAGRYGQLLAIGSTSEEILAAKEQDRNLADAALIAARADVARAQADLEMSLAQRANLRLVAPSDGLVIARDVEPGTTVVAGQAVVEVVDPRSLWIHVRFDQGGTGLLRAGLPAQVVLRSRNSQPLTGRVLRVEPRADAVTEETLAKVVFDDAPDPLPPIGELAEVTISLPELPLASTVPNAAVQRVGGRTGVWRVLKGELRFTPVTLGPADLDGHVQVRSGLDTGDRVVVYSAAVLNERSRIKAVERIRGNGP